REGAVVADEPEQVRLLRAGEHPVRGRSQAGEIERVAPSDVYPRTFRFAPSDHPPLRNRPDSAITDRQGGDLPRPEARIGTRIGTRIAARECEQALARPEEQVGGRTCIA